MLQRSILLLCFWPILQAARFTVDNGKSHTPWRRRVVETIPWRRRVVEFGMTVGTLKLDQLLVSNQAVRMIASRLSEQDDEIIAFMETDTKPQPNRGLWARMRSYLARTTDYRAPDGDVPIVEVTSGRFHGLSVFTKQTPGQQITVHPGVDVCCKGVRKREARMSAKGLLLRNASVGDNGILLIVGLGLSPKDARKAKQIKEFEAEVQLRRAEAKEAGKKLQIVAVGDTNTRLVLPEDDGFETELVEVPNDDDPNKNLTTRKLTPDCINRILHKLTSPKTRADLLDWEAYRFKGTAVGGIKYAPGVEFGTLSQLLYFMTDWWKDTRATPAMVTYKRRPWFDRMTNRFQEWMLKKEKCTTDGVTAKGRAARMRDSKGRMVATTAMIEGFLEQYLDEQCESPDYEQQLECYHTHQESMEFENMIARMQRQNSMQWIRKEVNEEVWREVAAAAKRGHEKRETQAAAAAAAALNNSGSSPRGSKKRDSIKKRESTGRRRRKRRPKATEAEMLKEIFFGMSGLIAKAGAKTDIAQQYLNWDLKDHPVYLQLGWLDAVGIGKGGFRSAKFKEFENEMNIWAHDHNFVKARISFRV